MEKKIALITGMRDQGGLYPAELLLGKSYEVHEIVPRRSNMFRSPTEHLRRDQSVYEHRLLLHNGERENDTRLRRIFAKVQPAEFFHLARQRHVGLSFAELQAIDGRFLHE
jgi:GDP-D-mannose dehydratase